MNKFIVLTTIQKPTKATIRFSEKKDWNLIVVGDKKTPHEDYKKINCTYLSPNDQEKINKQLSDLIGWNCIQRRNIGFLYAYMEGVDILATVDDDNIPYNFWGENLLIKKQITAKEYRSKNGYFDPLSITNYKELWHRGYPIEHVPTKNQIEYIGLSKITPLVQADLWNGDPDIDAICRLTYMPEVSFGVKEPFFSSQISPFNSQNTFLAREVIPYYMMLPHVGRMDDIWASYLVQEKFPNSVIYNSPSVYQDRNKHDIIEDLEKEIIGYRNTLDFIEGKYKLQNAVSNAYKIYRNSFEIKD